MAKRSSTLETTLLALEILRRIPRAPRSITAGELHEQLVASGFQRDLRTIQRQLDMLSAALDIERNDDAVPYRYQWLPHAKPLAIPHLNAQESLLLTLAEEHLRHLLPAHLMKSLEGFFAQAHRNLEPDRNAGLEREWPSKIRVVATTQPLLPPTIAPGVLDTVSEALYHNHRLRLDYKNADGRRQTLEWRDPLTLTAASTDDTAGGLTAPMPGKILSVAVAAGDTVTRGAPLLVMEAMKMEHTIEAPHDGVVKEVFYAVGDQVTEGVTLIDLEPHEN